VATGCIESGIGYPAPKLLGLAVIQSVKARGCCQELSNLQEELKLAKAAEVLCRRDATNFTQTPKKKKNEFWNCHLAMLGYS